MESDKDNPDVAGIQLFLKAGGRLIGTGVGHGQQRALDAANVIIAAPLLNLRNKKIDKLLINIKVGDDLEVGETHQILHMLRYAAHIHESQLFYSLTFDDTLQDEIQVTAMAQFK